MQCARVSAPAFPTQPSDLAAVHDEFMRDILPYAAGNVHPGFMGWVHGGGTPVGMLAEMLAAGLNANLGGRDHAPDRSGAPDSPLDARIFGFPESASGLFVTGTSHGQPHRRAHRPRCRTGLRGALRGRRRGSRSGWPPMLRRRPMAASRKALDIAGIGSDALRAIPVDGRHRIDPERACGRPSTRTAAPG